MRESPHWLCAWNADRITGLKQQNSYERRTSPQWVNWQTNIYTKSLLSPLYTDITESSHKVTFPLFSPLTTSWPPRTLSGINSIPEWLGVTQWPWQSSQEGSGHRKEKWKGRVSCMAAIEDQDVCCVHITGSLFLQVVRRQRVDFTTGQHQRAHFSEGKDTPTTKVLQVSCYNIKNPSTTYTVLALHWIIFTPTGHLPSDPADSSVSQCTGTLDPIHKSW